MYGQQSPNPVSPHPDPAMDVSFVVGPGASFRPVKESGNANVSEQSHEKNEDASNFLTKENNVNTNGFVKTTYDKGFEKEKPPKQSLGSSTRINEGIVTQFVHSLR